MRRVLVATSLVLALTALAFVSNSCGKGGASIKVEQDSIEYINGAHVGSQVKYSGRIDLTKGSDKFVKGFRDVVKEKVTTEYAHGVAMGVQYAGLKDADLNLDNFILGLQDVLNEKLSEEQLSELYDYMNELYEVRIPKRNLEEGEAYLEKIERENANVKKTESGLLYEIIEAGDMSHKVLSNEDKVDVVYEGTLKDGTVFDSSIERGDTATFAVNRVVKGWTEGLKLVGKGGKIKLWIPTELAYGKNGNNSIQPNEALYFYVELIDVEHAEVEETEEAAEE